MLRPITSTAVLESIIHAKANNWYCSAGEHNKDWSAGQHNTELAEKMAELIPLKVYPFTLHAGVDLYVDRCTKEQMENVTAINICLQNQAWKTCLFS